MARVSSNRRSQDLQGVVDWSSPILSTAAVIFSLVVLHMLDQSGAFSAEAPNKAAFINLSVIALSMVWYVFATVGMYTQHWDWKMRVGYTVLALGVAAALVVIISFDAVATFSNETMDLLFVLIIVALLTWPLLAARLSREIY